MIKIGFSREIEKIKHLPLEVVTLVGDMTKKLEYYYGDDRDVDKDMGGYILIIQAQEDLYELKNINLDIYKSYPEYVDRIRIKTDKGQVGCWTNTLMLCNNDFGISIIMPLELTPKNLIEEID